MHLLRQDYELPGQNLHNGYTWCAVKMAQVKMALEKMAR